MARRFRWSCHLLGTVNRKAVVLPAEDGIYRLILETVVLGLKKLAFTFTGRRQSAVECDVIAFINSNYTKSLKLINKNKYEIKYEKAIKNRNQQKVKAKIFFHN